MSSMIEGPSASPEKKKKKIVVADVSRAVESAARDAADAKLTVDTNVKAPFLSAERLKQIGRNIWKHNLAREYYRQKEIAAARETIFASDNIYATEGLDTTKHDAALQAVVEQFGSDAMETIHEDVGEKRAVVESPLRDEIFGYIYNFARNAPAATGDTEGLYRVYETDLREQIQTAVNRKGKDMLDQGTMFAENILDIAKDVKTNINHYKGIEDLDRDYEIIIGRARMGARTEANYNRTDKILEAMQNNRFTAAIASPLAIGASAALATIAGKAVLSRGAAWATFGIAGVAAGAFAYKQESKRLKEERRQHQRERAVGKQFTTEAGSRRVEMEKYAYEMQSANDLARTLEDAMEANNPDTIIGALAQVDARVRISDRHGGTGGRTGVPVDLISFSDVSVVTQERLALDIARAEAKTLLKKEHGFTNETLDQVLGSSIRAVTDDLLRADGGLMQKDRLFEKMRTHRARKAALIGTAVGLTVGVAAQEAYAAVSTGQAGLIETLWGGGGDRMTAAKSIVSSGSDLVHGVLAYINAPAPATLASAVPVLAAPTSAQSVLSQLIQNSGYSAPHTVRLSSGVVANLVLPSGATLVPTAGAGDVFELQSGGREIIGNLTFDQHGRLSSQSVIALAHEGIVADSTAQTIRGAAIVTLDTKTFVASRGDMVDVRRLGWQDWGTKKPDWDELKLIGGGGEGAKIVTGPDGQKYYEMSMKGMTRGGMAKLRGGTRFDLFLTVSDDTQGRAFKFSFGPDGKARIPADSDVGKLLFEEKIVQGEKMPRAVFQGRFAEVAEYKTDTSGRVGQRMWATDTGASTVRSVETVIPTDETKFTTTLHADPMPPAPTPPYVENNGLESPWLIPFASRRALERARDKNEISPPPQNPVAPVIPGQASERAKELKGVEPLERVPDYRHDPRDRSAVAFEEDAKKRLSETLRNSPDAALDQYTEIETYVQKFDAAYKEEINDLARQAGPMSPECRAVICIPVAGHQEGENIYATLENYTFQKIDRKNFEILLLVNRPDIDREDRPVVSDTTMREITKFQRDYPDMPVRVMDKVLPRDQARIGNIRKMLNDAALLRHHERGRDVPDLIVISNDADNKGVAPEYVENFIEKFDQHPEVDGMLGQLDWDPEAYIRNPLIHIGTRLFQYMNMLWNLKEKAFASSGANFSFRSSTYAAIGGYSARLAGGEDTDLGARIRYARSGASGRMPIAYGGARVSRMYTSARRAEKAIKDGLAPFEQWDRGFSAFDDAVRKVKWGLIGDRIDFDDPTQVNTLVGELERVISRTVVRGTEASNKERRVANTALRLLGINYVYERNAAGQPIGIKITDARKLIENLKRYQTEGMSILNRKSGRAAVAA